jgi:hypothetical protein
MTNKKSNFSQTTWDLFQYGAIPVGFLAGVASDPRTTQALSNLMAMSGGSLRHELPLAISKGVNGLHHVERVIEHELKGRLKKLVNHTHLHKHLSGSGFENMKRRPNKQRKIIEALPVEVSVQVPKSSSSSYLIPLGALLSLGVGGVAYANSNLINAAITGNPNVLGFNFTNDPMIDLYGSGFQEIDRDRNRQRLAQMQMMQNLDKRSSSWGPILLGVSGLLAAGAGGAYYMGLTDKLPTMAEAQQWIGLPVSMTEAQQWANLVETGKNSSRTVQS